MKDLINRLRTLGASEELGDEAADALEAQQAEIEGLKARLEIDPHHHVDGIESRDTTIKLLEVEIEALRADAERYRFLRADSTKLDSVVDAARRK